MNARVYVEKRSGFDLEAQRLKTDVIEFFGAQFSCLAHIQNVRVLFRYDIAGLTAEQFEKAVRLVFSEPQCDRVFFCDDVPLEAKAAASAQPDHTVFFGAEYLPGQYDQKADSAEQCTELAVGVKPSVRCAKFFVLVSAERFCGSAVKAVQSYLINPVDSRLVQPPALEENHGAARSDTARLIPILEGFTHLDEDGLARLSSAYGLAMPVADLMCCRDYFVQEGRDPTLTELRVLDTYWSDHCRHTTFTTELESIDIESIDITKERGRGDGGAASGLRNALTLYEEARREVYGNKAHKRTLMDMAVIGTRVLKKRGLLADLDESPEINACTIRVTAEFTEGQGIVEEPWLLLFKNETHNHPTEIEPFGGAATCLGGAIRDPLSGRAYVYQAMRVTGCGDPRRPLAETLPGKLPQIKIAREAAAGFSSYGNQIGLAVGQVAEFYHPGFLAKRLELGAVIGAVPEAQVHRAPPEPGDLVLLIGGKTGRDGIGGATGSSKVHTGESVETAGAEVQKGNAVEERKLQRLFRDPEVTRLIKRCNDFGAGGVSVAVGELAPGLDIDLDAVPKKYAGLNGTELAISESQERMAVVVAPELHSAGAGEGRVSPAAAETLIRKAAAENLDAVVIAGVTRGETEGPEKAGGETNNGGARLRMTWQGRIIADLSRDFLDSHGAPRSAKVLITAARENPNQRRQSGGQGNRDAGKPEVLLEELKKELASLRGGSRRGLQERFDGSIGASSVLFPWGGKEQGTPECGMAAFLPSFRPDNSEYAFTEGYEPRGSLTASLMSFGFDPALTEADPYEGAKGAVKEALAKFACLGGDYRKARLSMQEYFERMESPESWGKPAAALLGALEAQLALEVPAIGGKDSMSGSYRDQANNIDLAVPPTLVVFAAGTAAAAAIRSGALSGRPGNPVVLLYGRPEQESAESGEWSVFKANMNALAALTERGLVRAAYPVGAGGVAAALALMAFGNMTGLEARAACLGLTGLTGLIDAGTYPGSALVELDGEALNNAGGEALPGLLRDAVWKEAALTIAEPVFRIRDGGGESAELPLTELRRIFEAALEHVYPLTAAKGCVQQTWDITARFDGGTGSGKTTVANKVPTPSSPRPLAVLPVFPGTNCEWDMERAFREAGARTRVVVFRNRNAADIAASIEELAAAAAEAQIIALSGGFSAGDEPDGSGKFIANALRAPAVADALSEFMEKRDGLILGICNGFQALIKLGLVPYGRAVDASERSPVLTFNRIGRHVSRMARTVVMPSPSPWLALEEPGTVHILPVSHGEGRMVISRDEAEALFKAGQVPFCYCDPEGNPTLEEPDNPNGSDYAIEAMTSPDGRILGKMGHSERRGPLVHVNIPGNKVQRIFEAGVRYFS